MAGREFLRILDDYGAEYDDTLFSEPKGTGLLGHLQESCFQAVNIQQQSAPSAEALKNDASLRIFACHSPQRECEVARDVIADAMRQHQAQPHDFLVLTPDPETYAPYLQAACQELDDCSISLSVADRSIASANSLAVVVNNILTWCTGRLALDGALEIIQSAPVAQAWNLSRRELRLCEQWLRAARVCGFRDAEQRQQQGHGSAEDAIHTWHHGLARLRYTLVMGSHGPANTPFFSLDSTPDILPIAAPTHNELPTLERLLDIIQWLLNSADFCRDEHPWSAWCSHVSDLTARITPRDDEHDAHQIFNVSQ